MKRFCFAAAALLFAQAPAPAAEKWADTGYKMPDGLVLWLDATRQKAAWQEHGRTLTHDAAMDVWYDGSGNKLHFVQPAQGMQPRFVDLGSLGLVRFEGKHFFTRNGLGRDFENFSLYLVAAPYSNPGEFSGLFAFTENGKNDYMTGFNIDQGPFSSALFETINVEGAGFGGFQNLLKKPHPFRELRVIEVHRQPRQMGVQLAVDGQTTGARAHKKGTLKADQLFVGARHYNNGPEAPWARGFFDGEYAEVLLFDRDLSEKEQKGLAAHLRAKYDKLAALTAAKRGHLGKLLKPVADSPQVQMLVPGFTVREVPVDLPNLNNLRYRHDGKLVALGYNGNVYLLSDSDGDGLEDRAQVFWENKTGIRGPIGIALTPKGYAKGNGLFVASKGKVSLIVDTDGDDKADEEIVVAKGWKEIFTTVDAVGLALDKDGNIYFGLGTADFSNAYQKTKDGKALYNIKSENGTIQKVSPDFSKRETVCTGVRFTIGMAFNRHGDLFVSDQEGATWLPNGNPFDELLHIQPGKHYGFPPRHPKILPGVIDEPSVFDYGPQHQSTCGLLFNDGVQGGPQFGPADWAGDAIVCGESRGKLYRTKLVKTEKGYVAQNHLFACLQMLTVDACVSPKGELVVCCHSGPPDWGTGPQGKGKLFKITYTDSKSPQPALAWSAGPGEVRVAFDKPLDPAHLKDLVKQTRIEQGVYVRAGDRFETLFPPYAIVQMQRATPRFDVPVLSAQVTPDQRTLVLSTRSTTEAMSYAITLPGLGRSSKSGAMSQHATVDVGYDLHGVHAEFKGVNGEAWAGWLPHLDLDVSRAFTETSAEHAAFWKLLDKEGSLILKTKLNLWNMLRPALQPGTTIDYDWPEETVALTFSGAGLRRALTTNLSPEQKVYEKNDVAIYRFKAKEGELIPLELQLRTGKQPAALHVSFATNEDARPRAIPLGRFHMPWASLKKEEIAQRDIPEIKGGNWHRGKQLFFGDAAQCSRCHVVRGEGGKLGPDLSNLVQRDYDSVLRDIRTPSAALNPDHLTYVVALKDGRTLTGTLRSDGNKLFVGNNEGKETPIENDNIDQLGTSPVSVMPEGLDKKLAPDDLRDLMTFLLTESMQPAPLERTGAPAPRKKAEVDAILKTRIPPLGLQKKVHVVLAAGPKDHGPGEHDYPLWQRRWLNLLSHGDGLKVDTAYGWPSEKQWQTADVIVFYSAGFGWEKDKAKDLDVFLARGGGLVYIHWAVEGRKDAGVLAERIGLASDSRQTKFRHGPLEMTFDPKHPITRGFGKTQFLDESYWNLVGDPKNIRVLGECTEDKSPRPQLWTVEKGKGRVFVCILGHYTWTFDDPLFRILMLRGIAWTADTPVDRWLELATIGARLEE